MFKRDASKRVILNLKRLNKLIDFKHSKMESLKNVIELIGPGDYMATIYLKDFFEELVRKSCQANLTFFVEECLKFVYMPNGYGPAIRILRNYEKLKIPFFLLREKKISCRSFMLLTHVCKGLLL